MEKKSSINISFSGLLTCIFIALKLMKIITWSWVWVLSPLWISFVIGLIIFAIIGIVAIVLEGK